MPKLGKKGKEELKKKITDSVNKHVGHTQTKKSGEPLGELVGVVFLGEELLAAALQYKDQPFATVFIDTPITCSCGEF